MEDRTERKRMVHYDLLRIAAAFSVVMLHSAAQFWNSLDIASLELRTVITRCPALAFLSLS